MLKVCNFGPSCLVCNFGRFVPKVYNFGGSCLKFIICDNFFLVDLRRNVSEKIR